MGKDHPDYVFEYPEEIEVDQELANRLWNRLRSDVDSGNSGSDLYIASEAGLVFDIAQGFSSRMGIGLDLDAHNHPFNIEVYSATDAPDPHIGDFSLVRKTDRKFIIMSDVTEISTQIFDQMANIILNSRKTGLNRSIHHERGSGTASALSSDQIRKLLEDFGSHNSPL